MTTDVTKAERTAFQNVIGAAVADILPKSMREDFLANYTCMPPPIFMIFISLVEVEYLKTKRYRIKAVLKVETDLIASIAASPIGQDGL